MHLSVHRAREDFRVCVPDLHGHGLRVEGASWGHWLLRHVQGRAVVCGPRLGFGLRRATSCPDEKIDCMRRAGSDEDFTIRPLRCCVSPGEVPDLGACPGCALGVKLPKCGCDCFSTENLAKEITWLKRQPTIEGKNHDKVTPRLRTYKGTVGDLLASVEAKTKPYLYHVWLARFTRRQFHLDCDYFDPDTEAVLLADFSTAMILGSGYKATCETDATANLYVVLVLYKARSEEGEVETKCDYVRFWSSAGTSAEFHHQAMHAVVKNLKDTGKVPGLKRLRVWTDGHSSTYKGPSSLFDKSNRSRCISSHCFLHRA